MMTGIFLILLAVITQIAAYNWRDLAISGNSLAAVSFQEGIFTSQNGGLSWKQSKAPIMPWNTIATSQNGNILAATASKHGLFISKDGGNHWIKSTQVSQSSQSSNVIDWRNIKMSSNGQVMFACTEQGIFQSQDFGNHWENTLNIPGHWHSITMDATGQYGMVVGLGEGVYSTKNSGKTWTLNQEIPSLGWIDATMDQSGQHIAVVGLGDGIYTSSNYGQSFVKSSSAPEMMWQSVTSDSTGQYVAAAANGDGIYTSADYGKTWSKSTAMKASWLSIAMTANGMNVYATANQDHHLYESHNRGKTWQSWVNKLETVTPLEYEELFSVPNMEAAVESITPTELPSSRPSGQPTYMPSSRPSHPTAKPTPHPTAPLTPASGTQVDVNGQVTINGVNSSTLNTNDQDTIQQSLYNISGGPYSLELTGTQRENRRMLLTNLRLEQVVNDYIYLISFKAVYFTSQFPGLNASTIAKQKTALITTNVNDGTFQAVLTKIAMENGASHLFNVTVTLVGVTSNTVAPSSGNNNGLSDGQIAGIVIGTIVGAFLLFVLMYYLIVYRRKSHDYRQSGAYNEQALDMVVLDSTTNQQHAQQTPGVVDDHILIHVDDMDKQPQGAASPGMSQVATTGDRTIRL